MQQKYAGQDVVFISVSVDPSLDVYEGKPKEARAAVLKFLETRKAAALTNLLLDEKDDVWQAKLDVVSLPCLYVFNRAGKWQKFSDDFKLEAVDKLVAEWLKK
jgi:hypothetical protein